jgi:hypothetical protein
MPTIVLAICISKDRPFIQSGLVDLQAENSAATAYMDAIPHTTWTYYAFPYPRFGHNTSNIIESLNSVWNPLRSLPPLKMVDAI